MTRLAFNDADHTYKLDGGAVPGVTSVLEPYTGLEFVNWELLKAAAEFGNHVHQACHLFNMDDLHWGSLDPALIPYVEAWRDFLRDSGAVVIESEERVYSARHGYAGTLDTTCLLKKTKRIYDIKTGTTVPKTVGPQIAAYNQARREMTGESLMRRYCVHLKGDGKYNVVPLKNPRDWDIFKAALMLHRWHKNYA